MSPSLCVTVSLCHSNPNPNALCRQTLKEEGAGKNDRFLIINAKSTTKTNQEKHKSSKLTSKSMLHFSRHTLKRIGEGGWVENRIKLTGKAEIRKAECLAVGKA